ncbi:hypothetical protein K1T35_47920 (plasmid) [Pseudonocardia sp. DSM 110487]|uniref:DUF6879 family protein n=1 Tax=Pseudonocardia sp. DSM 110487 TaxID=2865833 RepID=UPI001C69D1BC|nr:DUF6879 family protein [Pseudonocardia sp. DSM 110487]QYN41079.1 hypothetical protein K1T35_47920 [Pseudonocardia sp. DSM 110487]
MSELLDEQGLGDYIDAHYRDAGDHLFRMERLPLYDVPDQNADREAFLAGRAPDWARKQQWLDTLAEEARRGLVSRRVRIFSEQLTDDELMACHYGYPFTGRYEDVRVLHAGEHPPVQLLDHDYWVMQPAGGPVSVLRMHYDAGRFVGASVVPPADHRLYLREQQLAWTIAEPFVQWWGRHPELHRTLAA